MDTVPPVSRVAADAVQPRWRAALEAVPMRLARTCYDHLAGVLGVALTETMIRRKHLEPCGSDFRLPPAGERFFVRFGVNLKEARAKRRQFARLCLDWSERRPHLAGSLGAALAERCFELGSLRHLGGSRSLSVTKQGRAGLRDVFAIALTS